MRWLLCCLSILALWLEGPGSAQAQTPWDAQDTLIALDDPTLVNARLVRCIVRLEVGGGKPGWEPYDPNMPHGERMVHGPGGLHEQGLLRDYVRWANATSHDSDPHNPYSVVLYIDQAISLGYARSAYPQLRDGRC